MEISTRTEKHVVVVSVKGKMDAASSTTFEKEVDSLIAGGSNALIVDFSDLNYISSAGVRSLLILAKKLEAKQGKLSICSPKDIVLQVLKISGFIAILPVYESVESALAQM